MRGAPPGAAFRLFMKVTYFNYYLEDHHSPLERIICDLRQQVFRFCAYDNREFRISFQYKDGESIFVFWVAENTYLFIITKNNEIIKTINSSDVSHGNLYDRFQANESLGFASYL